MGVFDIFSSKHGFDPTKFEKEFSQLTANINKTKQQLARLTQRKRSLNARLEAFVSIGYVLIFMYCYFSIPNDVRATNRVQKFIKGQSKQNIYVLIIYPLASILVIKIINYVFNYLINRQDRYLSKLQTQHKAKMDELKKITNFNATNELINKYGEKQVPQQIPQQLQKGVAAGKKKNNDKQEKLRAQALKELHLNDKQLSSNQKATPVKNRENAVKAESTQVPSSHPRTFQDRLLDLFVGSDNSESVEQRYALICSHCFAHNGLAPPHCEDPSLVKYQCWRCGALNGKGMLFGHSSQDQQKSDGTVEEKPLQRSIPEPDELSVGNDEKEVATSEKLADADPSSLSRTNASAVTTSESPTSNIEDSNQ
ncbi:hypothetical protein KGF57_002728 [Candida theae]|uniref:Endoplasmic reticulum junction formation protein lunapark n=1 Tax=Candida theae TaxID=1198502 RepID=A0AAD5BEV4_9ASCO|nr:uncharacterized protein KGF57_002728 [Candida theae]KAI5958371.1 hypothetical protein KGF57_002728 [Candida theae]